MYTISYSASIQKGEVLEAYTLKKDGRQIPVPEGNYQVHTNDGRDKASPMFSDLASVSVVFPDMAVGDMVHIRYRVAAKEPVFPGQFSVALNFSPTATTKTRVTVRLPRGMEVKTKSHFLQAVPARSDSERTVLEWRYRNAAAALVRGGRRRLDSGETPSVLISTFSSYEAIARPMATVPAQGARPHRTWSGDARQRSPPARAARLLYEWVSRNITYGGNCIGLGAVVPRDMDVVLDNKMGDCKDHDLAAGHAGRGGIQASGPDQRRRKVRPGEDPVPSLVNHVMNYLPDHKLRRRNGQGPFGYLPESTYAKPVIHVGAATALARVPAESRVTPAEAAHGVEDGGQRFGHRKSA